MGEADLTRPRDVSSADEPDVGNGVVGRAERPSADERRLPAQKAGHGEYLGRLDGLLQGEIGQDGRQALGQHGLAGARRPHHEHVVVNLSIDNFTVICNNEKELET